MDNSSTSLSEKLLKSLDQNKNNLISTYCDDVGYSVSDVEFLWADMNTFLVSFNEFYSWQQEQWKKESNLQYKWRTATKTKYIPWGKCLVVLPGNAIIPLLPMILISFISTGNQVEIIVPSKVKKTYEILSDILANIFGHSITINQPGVQHTLKKALLNDPPSFLYYIGGSQFKKEIYNMCIKSDVDLIYEGEGKSICVCDYNSKFEIDEFSKTLIKSKTVCNGQLCTSPNTVFVPKDIFDDIILSLSNVANIKIFRDTNLVKNMPFLNGHIINSYKSTSAPKEYSLHHLSREILPIAINHDMFSSATFLGTYDTKDDFVNIIEKYNGGIQVAVFSKNIQKWKDLLINNTSVARLVFNTNPVFQNSILPWGGYKCSGYSPPENFLEKSTRKVILENYV